MPLHHPRRVALALVLAVIGVALAVVAAGLWWPRRVVYSGFDGPLHGSTSRTRNVKSVPVGEVESWAMVILDNPKGHDVVLDDFRTRPPVGGGFELLGAYMANDPDRERAGQGPFAGRAPASLGRLVPVAGATVPARDDRGSALVLEVAITRPGLFWIEGVDVDFHVGGRKYTVKNETGLVLCGPKSVIENCPTFEDRPSEGCATLGYVPFGPNGCVPPSPGPG